jgi:hypothetical protein
MIRPQVPVIVAASFLLLLTGCGGPSAGPSPSESGPASSAGPSASPSPAAQGDPQPTLPITCADAFSDSAASALIYSPITLKIDQNTVRNVYEASGLQSGLFHCIWGGQNKTDNSWDQSIDLDILPNAAAAFDGGVWQVNDGAVVYPDGSTTSEYLCDYVDTNYAQCFANVLVGGYWAHATARTGDSGVQLTQAGMEASMRSIVDRLTAVLTSAGKGRDSWVPPSYTLTGAICAGQPLNGGFAGPVPAEAVATQRSGALGCSYSQAVNLGILPGGAWAVASVQASGKMPNWSVSTFEPTPVAGADLALWGCGDGCYALLSVGGSAVSIDDGNLYGGQGEAEFVAELPGIVATITAAG